MNETPWKSLPLRSRIAAYLGLPWRLPSQKVSYPVNPADHQPTVEDWLQDMTFILTAMSEDLHAIRNAVEKQSGH
jgi:hypothetical protein